MARKSPHHYKSIPKWYATPFPRPDCFPLTGRSLHNALRTFFQPVKTDDPRVNFYTVYKGESAGHDTEYVKKYEDLNTTLTFMRRSPSYLVGHLIRSCRLVCSLQSAPPLSSTSIRISNPILMNNPLPSFVPYSLSSTNPLFSARPPLFCPRARSQQPV